MPGKYIAFEGLDGCGKTTHSKRLVEELQKEGYATHWVSEPSSSKLGTAVRSLMSDEQFEMAPISQAMLFFADRYDAMISRLTPMLNLGVNIISDRSLWSSYVYQNPAIDWRIRDLFNDQLIKPQYVIYIRLTEKELMERINQRRLIQNDKLDNAIAPVVAYRMGIYEGLARQPENNFIPINGNRSIEEVYFDIKWAVKNILTK